MTNRRRRNREEEVAQKVAEEGGTTGGRRRWHNKWQKKVAQQVAEDGGTTSGTSGSQERNEWLLTRTNGFCIVIRVVCMTPISNADKKNCTFCNLCCCLCFFSIW